MDALCLKAGIHSVMAPPVSAAAAADKPSVSAAPPSNLRWGFTFRHPLRSLWPAGKNRFEPAIAVDDAVLVDEKEDNKANIGKDVEEESQNENWVVKILHVKSLWRSTEERGGQEDELAEEAGAESEECDACAIDYDDDYDEEEEDGDVGRIEFNRETFSRLLKKVPLAEARLYAQMSYLGNLAYSIPQIKPRNLLRYHRLRYVTSSLEKKEEASKAEKEKVPDEKDEQSKKLKETERKDEEKSNGNRISASAAYQIAALCGLLFAFPREEHSAV